MTVKLSDIIEALTFTDDEHPYFLDRKTDQLLSDIGDNALYDAIDDHPDQYLKLPDKEEIDDYQIMVSFIGQLPAGHNRTVLTRSIQGRGAFRNFRNQLAEFGQESAWYAFQAAAYRDLAITWCQDNQVTFEA